MVKKKKQAAKAIKKSGKTTPSEDFFMGLTKSQTQSLSVGIVIVGLGLFVVAGLAYKSNKLASQSILSEGARTYQPATAITPTNLVMQPSDVPATIQPSVTSEATATPTSAPIITQTPTIVPTATVVPPTATPMVTKTVSPTPTPKSMAMVKKLPNTSSKVTYTVEQDDSLATVGTKLCQSDRAWLSIAATNNLVYPYTIHPGETYIITCN